MIYSYAEMSTDIDEADIEKLNVPWTMILLKYFGIAEAVIQFGDTDAGKITAKIFAKDCETFIREVERILSEDGPIASLAHRIIQQAKIFQVRHCACLRGNAEISSC